MNIQTLILLLSAALSVFGLAAFFRFSAETRDKLAALEVNDEQLAHTLSLTEGLASRDHEAIKNLQERLDANCREDAEARFELARLYAQLAESGATRQNFAALAEHAKKVSDRSFANGRDEEGAS